MVKFETIEMAGPVGKLEMIYIPAEGVEKGVAVINHPNPLHGGTFTNKVIQTAAKALSKLSFHCYLPNLRGVGNSEGVHDYGAGETEDCVAVIDFARSRHPQAAQLAIAGFSFGGYVSLFASHLREPDLLLLMGPAVRQYERREPDAPNALKTLLIHGEGDEVITLTQASDWAEGQDIPIVMLPKASHFFHGKLILLRDTIQRLVPVILDK